MSPNLTPCCPRSVVAALSTTWSRCSKRRWPVVSQLAERGRPKADRAKRLQFIFCKA